MSNEKSQKNQNQNPAPAPVNPRAEEIAAFRAANPEAKDYPDSAVLAILDSRKAAEEARVRAETAEKKAAIGRKRLVSRPESIARAFPVGVEISSAKIAAESDRIYSDGGGKSSLRAAISDTSYVLDLLVSAGYVRVIRAETKETAGLYLRYPAAAPAPAPTAN